MNDECKGVSAKTWARAADPIYKIGYMNGAADGQKNTFQSSFDTGYEQGFELGLALGINNQEHAARCQLSDPRKINCQICLNSSTAQENVVNLYNRQKKLNDHYLENLTKK